MKLSSTSEYEVMSSRSGHDDASDVVSTSSSSARKPLHANQRAISVQRDSPVAFSPNGEMLAYAGENRVIEVTQYQRSDGQFTEFARLCGMTDVVRAIAFSPFPAAGAAGGSQLAISSRVYAAGFEGIFAWDLALGGRLQPVLKLLLGHGKSHDSPVECLCFAFGASTLVTGSKDCFQLWDSTETELRLLETEKVSALALAFSERLQLLATTGRDSQIKVWDASSIAPANRARRLDEGLSRIALRFNLVGHRGDVSSICFASLAHVLISGARDNTLKVWDLVNGEEMRTIVGHKADVRYVRTINDDKLLVSASLDGSVRIVQLGAMAVAPKAKDVDIADILADRSGLVLGAESELAIPQPLDTLVHAFPVHEDGCFDLALNPVLPLMATSGRRNHIRLFSIEKLTEPVALQEVIGHSGPVTAVALCANDQLVASASTDCHVYLFSTLDGSLHGKVHCKAGMLALAASPRDDLLVAAGNDFRIKLIPVGTSAQAQARFQIAAVLSGHAGKVTSLSISPDGKLLASVSSDFSLRVWPLRPGSSYSLSDGPSEGAEPEAVAHLAQCQPHKAAPTVVVWSPTESGLLATSSADHDITTWHFSASHSLTRRWHVPNAHAKLVSALAFGRADSAQYLFSGSWDFCVRVWAYTQSSALPIKQLVGHSARISAISLSRDGSHLVSASGDGTLRVWRADAPFQCECECFEPGPRRVVTSVDAGGTLFACGVEDGCVSLWSLADAIDGSHAEDRT